MKECQLKELSENIMDLQLDWNYCINGGGCAYFAAMLATKLSQLGYNAIPVWAGDYIGEIADAYDNGIPHEASHVFVTVKFDHEDIHIDSEGYTEDQLEAGWNFPCLETDNDYVMLSTFELPRGTYIWNEAFNKSNLPIIETQIDEAIYRVFGRKVQRITDKYLK